MPLPPKPTSTSAGRSTNSSQWLRRGRRSHPTRHASDTSATITATALRQATTALTIGHRSACIIQATPHSARRTHSSTARRTRVQRTRERRGTIVTWFTLYSPLVMLPLVMLPLDTPGLTPAARHRSHPATTALWDGTDAPPPREQPGYCGDTAKTLRPVPRSDAQHRGIAAPGCRQKRNTRRAFCVTEPQEPRPPELRKSTRLPRRRNRVRKNPEPLIQLPPRDRQRRGERCGDPHGQLEGKSAPKAFIHNAFCTVRVAGAVRVRGILHNIDPQCQTPTASVTEAAGGCCD